MSKSFGFDAVVRLVLEETLTWQTDEWQLTTEITVENGLERRTKAIETFGI